MIQTRLLGVLRDREPTMLELAGLLGLDKSSTTGLVDRRSTRVRLTADGTNLVAQVVTGFEADIQSATESLSDKQRVRLSRLASKVVRNQAQLKPIGVSGRSKKT